MLNPPIQVVPKPPGYHNQISHAWLKSEGWRQLSVKLDRYALFGIDLFLSPGKEVTLYISERKYNRNGFICSEFIPFQITHWKNGVDVRYFDDRLSSVGELSESVSYLQSLVK